MAGALPTDLIESIRLEQLGQPVGNRQSSLGPGMILYLTSDGIEAVREAFDRNSYGYLDEVHIDDPEVFVANFPYGTYQGVMGGIQCYRDGRISGNRLDPFNPGGYKGIVLIEGYLGEVWVNNDHRGFTGSLVQAGNQA